jgi:hypothetical protein
VKSQNARMALLGVAAAAAAFAVFGGLKGLGGSGPSEPFDALPRASFLAATVDLAELRRSPLYDAFLGKESKEGATLARALGTAALAEACGFDPLARVQRFAVALPEDGERGEFGVAAKVELSRDELLRCAGALATQRGGTAEPREVGSFAVLDDTRVGAAPRAGLAYGRSGLLLVGRGAWLSAMLGAADHTQPGLRDAGDHAALRASLTGREGFHAPTLLATAVLPRALRERLKGEMGVEVDAQDGSSAMMAGVLGVSAVGVALQIGGPGKSVDASVELVCDGDAGCEAVERLVQKKRKEWSGDLALRMVGLGPLLDSVVVKREGTRLRATASASAAALAATVERVMKLRARRAPPGEATLDAAALRRPDSSSARPDETLRARDGGADARARSDAAAP